MATLAIGSTISRCGSCGFGAMMTETGHYTRVGWGVEPGTEGCGEEWDRAVLTYFYPESKRLVASIENSWMPEHIKELLRAEYADTYRKVNGNGN